MFFKTKTKKGTLGCGCNASSANLDSKKKNYLLQKPASIIWDSKQAGFPRGNLAKILVAKCDYLTLV